MYICVWIWSTIGNKNIKKETEKKRKEKKDLSSSRLVKIVFFFSKNGLCIKRQQLDRPTPTNNAFLSHMLHRTHIPPKLICFHYSVQVHPHVSLPPLISSYHKIMGLRIVSNVVKTIKFKLNYIWHVFLVKANKDKWFSSSRSSKSSLVWGGWRNNSFVL